MIEITIDIEEKYYKFEFNPLQIRSFQAQKFLIEELCRRNKYDEAINCCYKIVTGTILKEQGQQDNPVAHYFAKKAVEVFKEYISKNAKSKTFRTDILFDTLAYACYNSADEDVWFLLSILGQKVGDTNYSSILDSLAIIYWQLRKELSNKQLRYIVNILEKVDKERYYHPDWIVLVSKNKRYAIKLFKKKNFVLENESLRDIQNDIEKSLRRDFFELSED